MDIQLTCDGCGFHGELVLFRTVGNVMCCGPLVFQECPRCGNKVICDRQEMRDEFEDAAREMAGRVDVAIREGRISEAKKMLKVLSQLNQCLNSSPLDEFIKAARRRIRQAGVAPA